MSCTLSAIVRPTLMLTKETDHIVGRRFGDTQLIGNMS